MDDATGRSIRQLHCDYRRLLRAILADLGADEDDAARLAELLIVLCDNADLWSPAGNRDVGDAQEFAWRAARRLAGLC